MTPADELRIAIGAEYNEWGDGRSQQAWPKATAIHLALIELLDNNENNTKNNASIISDNIVFVCFN